MASVQARAQTSRESPPQTATRRLEVSATPGPMYCVLQFEPSKWDAVFIQRKSSTMTLHCTPTAHTSSEANPQKPRTLPGGTDPVQFDQAMPFQCKRG